MSIEEFFIEHGKKSYQYKEPSEDILFEEISHVCELLKDLVKRLGVIKFPENISINDTLFSSLAIRIDKRRDYFLIFHKQTHINEIKKAALYAYWILKFKPIRVVNIENNETIEKYNHINEMFAAFIIFSAIREKTGKNIKLSDEYVKELMYAFKYWDISKEALILIAETLSEMVNSPNNK